MGQLLDFPFAASVWGTAAAWVGAIGTTAAFLLGSNVYRRDAKLRRYEQAVMVRVSETSIAPLGIMALNPEKLTIEVHNTSEKYIFSVTGSLDRRSLFEFLADLTYWVRLATVNGQLKRVVVPCCRIFAARKRTGA